MSETEPSSRVYVGNLPYVAQETDVAALFEANGLTVSKIDISIDPFTGRNPSYCFVELPSPEDAALAIRALEGKELRGRAVRVNFKTEKRQPSSRPPTKVFNGWNSPRQVPTPNAPSDSFAFDRWARKDASSHWTDPSEEKRRLYVGGLPSIPNQDAVQAHINELFTGFDVQAISKLISPHASTHGKPGSHYYCFVDLPTSQEAEAAREKLHMSESSFGGQYQVKLARQNDKTKVQREQLGAQDSPRNSPRRVRTPPPQPQRNFEASWRRKD